MSKEMVINKDFMVKVEGYFKKNIKRYSKTSNEEVFVYLELHLMKDIINLGLSKNDLNNMKEEMFKKFDLIRAEYSVKNLSSYFSYVNRKRKDFSHINASVYYQEIKPGTFEVFTTDNIETKNLKSEKFVVNAGGLKDILSQYNRRNFLEFTKKEAKKNA